MDRKSAPRTRTRAAIAFSSFRNAIGIETTINCDHERGVLLVDALEQIVQSKGHEDKTGLADEVARDAEAKERFGPRHCRCATMHPLRSHIPCASLVLG